MRRYGPILQFSSYGRSYRMVQPFKDKPLPAKMVFTLERTPLTDELKQLTELDCGTMRIPICWVRDQIKADSSDAPRPFSGEPRGSAVSGGSGASGSSAADPSSLEDLDDDCLLAIFEQDALTTEDLFAIAGTCTRLSALAKRAIRAGFRTSDVRPPPHPSGLSDTTAIWAQSLAHSKPSRWPSFLNTRKPFSIIHSANGAAAHRYRALNTILPVHEALFLDFGEHMTAIELFDGTVRADILLGFIAKYCANIEQLACSRVDGIFEAIRSYQRLPLDRQNAAQPPFAKLHTLEYVTCTVTIKSLPPMRLPRLRHFGVCDATLSNRAEIETFFRTNGNLQVLRLRHTYVGCHIRRILQYSPGLQELDVVGCAWNTNGADENDVKCFARLQKLQRFAFDEWRQQQQPKLLSAMLKAGVPLRYIEFRTYSSYYPELLVQAPNIEEVQIFGLYSDGVRRLTAAIAANAQLQLISQRNRHAADMIGFRRIANNDD